MKHLEKLFWKFYSLYTRRLGHEPGPRDVSTMAFGQPFQAKPNFRYHAKGRPCWLPINPGPKLGDGTGTWPVTLNWPCEFYGPHLPVYGFACWSWRRRGGDWLDVIGQIRGQRIRDDTGQSSDVWDVVRIPDERIVRNRHNLSDFDTDGTALGFVPDIWMGNTGWRDIPFIRGH